jgi:hypothetical protein
LLLFTGIVGCGTVENPPSEAASAGEIVDGDSQSLICPFICGPSTETLCRFPDGSCTEECNSCLCTAAGGKAVTSCRGQDSSQASPSQASLSEYDALVGGTCGNTICGKGTFCCNASCGICAPIGGFCTQQFCNTAE